MENNIARLPLNYFLFSCFLIARSLLRTILLSCFHLKYSTIFLHGLFMISPPEKYESKNIGDSNGCQRPAREIKSPSPINATNESSDERRIRLRNRPIRLKSGCGFVISRLPANFLSPELPHNRFPCDFELPRTDITPWHFNPRRPDPFCFLHL